MLFWNIVIFPDTTIIPRQVFSMAAKYYIWTIRIWIQLNRKRFSNHSKSKKILISGRIGLPNPDPVHHWYTPETITIRFASWISGRIVSLQPDTDIQNLLWNGNRIRISETLLLIFREFRLLEKVAHYTIIHLLSSFRSIFSGICDMTPSLSMVYPLYHSVISFLS